LYDPNRPQPRPVGLRAAPTGQRIRHGLPPTLEATLQRNRPDVKVDVAPRLCSPRRRKGLDDQEYLIIHQSLKRPAKEEIVEEVSNQLSNNRSGRRYTSGDCPAVSSGRKLRALALSPFVRQRLTMVTARQRASDLERLTKLIEAGTVTPSIGATYPLDQVPDAMRHLEAGEARGKIAITI